MEAVSEREEAASCSAGEEITESQMMDSCERTKAQNFHGARSALVPSFIEYGASAVRERGMTMTERGRMMGKLRDSDRTHGVELTLAHAEGNTSTCLVMVKDQQSDE